MPGVPPRERLRRVASELEPDALPFYVPSADRRHRAAGWYWRPAGVEHNVFLGHNHVIAEIALLEILDRRDAALTS